jgi:hypothetical protein
MSKILKTNSGIPFIEIFSSSKSHIPNWYKKSKQFSGEKVEIKNLSYNSDIKKCVPFLDSLTSGYMIELWTDIQVTFENGKPIMTWLVTPDPVSFRSGVAELFPIPAGHNSQHMSWNLPIFLQTPKGYSSLITHPLNRHDLPFLSLSGIVDTDGVLYPGNYPFFIKDGFEGIIPAGTPIAQIIPFKRDNWERKNNEDIVLLGKKRQNDSRKTLLSFYKKFIWKKKEYL